ncbi:hypothetical protein HELRODRAFT_86403, partial [Helobdella robusta]|uniref:Torsin-1A C-terminal domain-containing protein n=1 Tax=Helobdella robusta TaxID=6412 RepID=T1G6B7_HELRO
DLTQDLHGQHLVIKSVVSMLKGHMYTDNPSKALVFSFHGWSGSGKNFVSEIIARNLFFDGRKSRNVKLFVASHHFPHASEIHQYEDMIRESVRIQVSQCKRALFIFDEMDKMPVGLIDTIKPYLDHHHEIDGLDYRKAIFILLSNTGGKVINELTYDHWMASHDREKITLHSVQMAISKSAFNEVKGGLWHGRLIESNLITAFIPFLPLERHHVKLCIRDEFRRKGREADEKVINLVADELHYWPETVQLYSMSGCKRISERVGIYMHDEL